MDTITLNEAIIADLVGRGSDPADVIARYRIAQEIVAMHIHGDMHLDMPLPVEVVDDIMIHATQNGRADIFRL